MTADLLDRLNALDPAGDANLTPREDLLARLLAVPPSAYAGTTRPARPARRRLGLALAGTGLAAGVLGVVSLTGGGTAVGPDLAAKAYAQTADEIGVLHVRVRSEGDYSPVNGKPEHTAALEESWQHGARAHSHTTFLTGNAAGSWSDSVLTADGKDHFRNSYGQVDVTTVADGPDAKDWHDRLATDFVAAFRKDYEDDALGSPDIVTFAGRRAQRFTSDSHYVIAADDRRHLPGGVADTHREFFIDADDGTPLGLVVTDHTTTGGHSYAGRRSEIVEQIERLPVTPESLALLDFKG
jgi:hypothetical protein